MTRKAKNNIILGLSGNKSGLKTISDAFLFARNGRVLEGVLPLVSLDRLHDQLAEVAGQVAYRIEGLQGERGEALLRLRVTGSLPLLCQRCLRAVVFDLDVDSLLELVPEGVELSQDELENDARDFLPVASELRVADFVEDEVVLSLPLVPRHENCGFPGKDGAEVRITPFAALAGLKGKLN